MANQIVVSAGAKVRNLSGVLTATSGVVSFLPIDVSLGIPQLDVNGKILVSQLPNSVMEYKGTWNAATNTPTLANGTGNQGDVYLCNVAGTVDFGAGPIAFFVGDQVIYSGSIWQRASGATGTVTSVAVTESGDSLNITGSPITTSGTINIGFNGTNLQYVNGAGNLTTFPDLTGFVPYTGATANVNIGTHSFIANNGTYNSEMSPSLFGVENAAGTIFGLLEYNKLTLTNSTGAGSIMEVNAQGLIFPDASVQISSYTDAKARLALSLTTTGTSGVATYNNTTGVFNIPNYGSALSGYVPYTGATQDVDLGAFKLNAQSLHIKGTAGNGHLGLKHQSASATASANEVSLFADSLGDFSWLNGNLYLSKFITSGNTAARSYTFPNANGTVALTSDLSGYVTLATTQTITGAKTFSGAVTLTSSVTTNNLTFANSGFFLTLQPPTLSVNRTVTFADITGTIAMLEGTQTFTGYKTFDAALELKYNVIPTPSSAGNIGIGSNGVGITITTKPVSTVYNNNLYFASASNTFTFPNATGTIALTSDISYPVTSVFGRTGAVVATSGDYTTAQVTESGNLYFTDSRARLALSFVAGSGAYNSTTGVITIPTNNNQITNGAGYTTNVGTVTSVAALTIGTSGTDLSSTVATSTTTPVITLNVPTASATNRGALSSADWTTFNSKQGTITLTTTGTSGAATFTSNTLNIPNYGSALSGYLPLTGGTLTGALNGTTISTSGSATFGSDVFTYANGGIFFNGGGSYGSGIFQQSGGNLILQTGTTPRLTIASTGAATFSSSVTAANYIVSNTAGAIFTASGGTSAIYGYINNTSGRFYWGSEGSTPSIIVGSSSYYGVIASQGLQISANTGDNVHMTITPTGNVGIGTSSPSGLARALVVSNTSDYPEVIVERLSSGAGKYGFLVGNDGSWLFRNYTAGTNPFIIASTGASTFTSSVTATSFFESSDSRLKTLIQDNYQTKGIASITPKLYTKNGKVELGYYAQDFVGVLDSAVSKGSDDMLSLSYREVLVAKMYALEQEIKELKAKMN